MKYLVTLFLILSSGSIHADTPQEIQGVWVPDIERTISLMEENMEEVDSAYMREKFLPKLERTITVDRYIHKTGKRELKADISLKEDQNGIFTILLSNDSVQSMEINFIPKDNGAYIMQSQNPSDGSGNII